MITGHIIAALLPAASRSVRRWLFHLGGLGLIPLGLLDSSVIPLPGTLDVATILLSARQGQLWLYYALNGDCRFGDRRLCYLPPRSQRRERSARTQIFAQESGQSLRDLRTMGVRRDCHPCFAAASFAHGSISACGRRHAISGEKIPGCAHARANFQILDTGLSGRALWTANHRLHRRTRTPRPGGSPHGADCRDCRGFLLLARKQEQQMDMEIRRAFLLKSAVR